MFDQKKQTEIRDFVIQVSMQMILGLQTSIFVNSIKPEKNSW